MTRKVAKWLSLGVGAVVLLVVTTVLALYWRLQQGPMRLPLLEPHVRAALDDSLRDAGVRVTFRDVVLEIDRHNGLPTLRLRDLALRALRPDRELASAPRAAIALSGRDLLAGKVHVRHLELVGVRLLIHRDATGSFSAGLMRENDAASRQSPDQAATRADAGSNARHPHPSTGIMNHLRKAFSDSAGGAVLGTLESLRITQARIIYRDERMNVLWQAPNADLVLRRVPYGFALLGKTTIEGLGRRVFPLSMNAVWRREDGHVSISMQLRDADVAELLNTARSRGERLHGVHLPFSARLGVEVDAAGNLQKASAEVLLGAGRITMPDWLARPVDVREGALRLDYRPQTEEIRISQGEVRLATGRLRLSGLLRPVRDAGVSALALDVKMQHAPANAARLLLEGILLKGMLQLSPLQFSIDDMQLHGDGAAMRLRGVVRREADAAGIYVSGRGRNISHRLLKALWPPRIGMGARTWLNENVVAGVLPSVTVRLAIPGKVLKAAVERDVPMPDNVADVRFSVAGVRFSYIDGWPLITHANGRGSMTGNHFRLELNSGQSRLPSGRVLKLVKGELRARDLAARVSPGRIDVRVTGPARAVRELVDSPPLQLLRSMGITKGEVRGKVSLNARLRLPFHRDMTGKDVVVERIEADIDDATATNMVKVFDLQRGRFRLLYEKGLLQVKGQARLNGRFPARLQWVRPVDEKAASRASVLRLQMRLTDRQRRQMGVDLAPWLTGPVDLEVEAPGDSWDIRRLRVRLGLDDLAMNLPAIGWSRAPRKGTRASLEVLLDERRGPRIRNLRLTGPGGLRVEGKVRLHPDGRFQDATFARFELDANNRLALGLELEKDRLNVVAAGPMFDARPLITRLFASRRKIDRSLQSVFVRVNLRQVLALRGERIENVRGEVEMRNGLVRRATLTGQFPSGRKVALDLVPARNGLRRLRIVSDDAGALLRASGLYSRVVEGEVEFTALLKSSEDGGVQRGLLIMRRFMVRGDQRLARLQRKGKRRAGPRRGQRFKKLVLPFSTDRHFIRIGDAIIRSPEIGATANGMIRRTDGAMDIGGVIIPAYALNAAFGKIPVLGALLTGGKGQGVFGMTYALKGSMQRPKFLVNPLSAVAPGIFRQLFHIGGQNVNPDGTPRRRKPAPRRRSRTNLSNGGG